VRLAWVHRAIGNCRWSAASRRMAYYERLSRRPAFLRHGRNGVV